MTVLEVRPRSAATRTPPARARRLDPALAALVLLAAVGCWLGVRHVTTWTLMTDEIFWSKLAISLGEGRLPPLVRGDGSSTSLLYPLLLAPLFRVLSVPWAFEAAHVLNVLLMASTAVPVFLLCRRVVASRALALLAAAVAVAVPWVALSTMLLTESAAYPASAWALLGMHRALVAPAGRSYAWLVIALAAAYLARTQLIVLAAVFPLSALGLALALPRAERRAALRRHAPLWVGCAAAAVAGVALLASGGAGVLLGNYQAAASGVSGTSVDYLGTAAQLVTVIGLGVGILPLVASFAWIPVAIRRGDTPDRAAFAVLGSLVIVAVVGFAAVYITTYGGADRYALYVAPVLVVGAAAALEDSRVLGTRYAGAGAAVGLLALASSLPDAIFHASPVAMLYPVLEGWPARLLAPAGLAPGRNLVVAASALAGGAGLALAVRLAGRSAAAPLLGAVLVFCCVATGYVLDRGVANQVGGLRTTDGRAGWGDWIDRAVGRGASVGLVASPAGDPYLSGRLWWDAEFWNASVDRVYVAPGEDDYATIPERTLQVDPDTGRAVAPWTTSHLVFASSDLLFRPAGRNVATTTATTQFPNPRLELWSTTGRAQAAWTTTGIRRDGWIPLGGEARIRVFSTREDASGRRVRIGVGLPAQTGGARAYELVLPGAAPRPRTLAPFATATEQAEICLPAGGWADVVVRPTGGPAPDPALGVRVDAIQVTPAPACRP